MEKRARKTVFIIAAAVFLVSGIFAVRQFCDNAVGQRAYEFSEKLVELPDFSIIASERKVPNENDLLSDVPVGDSAESPELASNDIHGENVPVDKENDIEPEPVYEPYAEALSAMNFTALREVNSDVLGWIVIPGTRISYPLLQGNDNSEYLNRTWNGRKSSVGSIFLDSAVSSDLTDHNSIVYGHSMINGSMFGSLKNYSQQSWFVANPYIYITDDSGTRVYAIFAAFEAEIRSDTYRLGFNSDEEKQSLINYALLKNVIDTGITPDVNDSILTLSTCTGIGYESRWVVQAILV